MNIWLAISLVLAVAAIYLLMIEFFSVALKLTGLANNKIRFQVASLFTGTGFTTAESELIANDEKRRKIATACIYTGHIFSVAFLGLIMNVVISIITSVYSDYASPSFVEWYFIILYVAISLFVVALIIKIPPVNRKFIKFLEDIAIKASKKNKNKNIITVIDLYGKHAIAEVTLNIVPKFADETPLFQMELTKKYSINILSIRRGKRIIDITKDTMFVKGDTIIIYGLINDINEAFINSVNGDKGTVIIDRSNEVTLVNNYGNNALVEVYVDEVPKELEGTKIKDAHLKDKYSITIGVIKRKDTYIYVDKDTIIENGDMLTLFGPYKNIKMLFSNVENEKEAD